MHHIYSYASYLYTEITSNIASEVMMPNGDKVEVSHIGTVRLNERLILNSVLCVPSFNFNLISARKLAEDVKCCLIFSQEHCIIQDLMT